MPSATTVAKKKGKVTMAQFYDVKLKKKVERPVIAKQVYTNGSTKRYALKGKTEDGRSLTTFCSKEVYDNTKVQK